MLEILFNKKWEYRHIFNINNAKFWLRIKNIINNLLKFRKIFKPSGMIFDLNCPKELVKVVE